MVVLPHLIGIPQAFQLQTRGMKTWFLDLITKYIILEIRISNKTRQKFAVVIDSNPYFIST